MGKCSRLWSLCFLLRVCHRRVLGVCAGSVVRTGKHCGVGSTRVGWEPSIWRPAPCSCSVAIGGKGVWRGRVASRPDGAHWETRAGGGAEAWWFKAWGALVLEAVATGCAHPCIISLPLATASLGSQLPSWSQRAWPRSQSSLAPSRIRQSLFHSPSIVSGTGEGLGVGVPNPQKLMGKSHLFSPGGTGPLLALSTGTGASVYDTSNG